MNMENNVINYAKIDQNGEIIVPKTSVIGERENILIRKEDYLTFSIYDLFVDKFGAGAIVCITSFGHLLIHGALAKAKVDGLLGLFTGMFSLTATGITATIIFAFIFTMIFKPKN